MEQFQILSCSVRLHVCASIVETPKQRYAGRSGTSFSAAMSYRPWDACILSASTVRPIGVRKMAKSLTSILSQIERLQKEAASIQSEIVARVRKDIAKYGLTAEQLFGEAGAVKPSRTKPGTKVAKVAKPPKYADDNGNTWGGLGKRPDWIHQALATGKTLEDFLIAKVGTSAPRKAKGRKATSSKAIARKVARSKPAAARKPAAKKRTAIKPTTNRKPRAKATEAPAEV
jgi:DNA-binding protein H-NS